MNKVNRNKGFVTFSRRLRKKFVGRTDDADTDSGSDADFNINDELKADEPAEEEKKQKIQHGNIELLQKRYCIPFHDYQ